MSHEFSLNLNGDQVMFTVLFTLLFVSYFSSGLTSYYFPLLTHFCASPFLASYRGGAAANQQGGGVEARGTCDLSVSASQSQPHHLE